MTDVIAHAFQDMFTDLNDEGTGVGTYADFVNAHQDSDDTIPVSINETSYLSSMMFSGFGDNLAQIDCFAVVPVDDEENPVFVMVTYTNDFSVTDDTFTPAYRNVEVRAISESMLKEFVEEHGLNNDE